MYDRNDIKFKGSLGSPPKIKWQLFSWALRPCTPAQPLPSLFMCFQTVTALQGRFPSPSEKGRSASPGDERSGGNPENTNVAHRARSSPVSTQFRKRGNNPVPLPQDSEHRPPPHQSLHNYGVRQLFAGVLFTPTRALPPKDRHSGSTFVRKTS